MHKPSRKFLSIVISALLSGAAADVAAQYSFGPLPVFRPGTITPLAGKPNLAWDSRQSYALAGPTTHELDVDGLGIDDVVDVFETIEPFTIGRDFANTSRLGRADGDYLYNLQIRQLIFGSFNLGTQIVTGWFRGDDRLYLMYEEDKVGPALNSGEVARAEFGPIDALRDFITLRDSRCGLYEATLRVDSDAVVNEINEQDNSVKHYFFIPSNQVFNLKVTPHRAVTLAAPVPTVTHTFSVLGSGGRNPRVYFANFSQEPRFTGIPLSTDKTADPRMLRQVPFAIRMEANPVPRVPYDPTRGKVTIISEDGCVVKQESVQVNPPPGPGITVFGPLFFASPPVEAPQLIEEPVLQPVVPR